MTLNGTRGHIALTEPRETLRLALIRLRAVLLVDPGQCLTDAQDLLRVNGDVAGLTGCAAGGFWGLR